MADAKTTSRIQKRLFASLIGLIVLIFFFLSGYSMGVKQQGDAGYQAGFDAGRLMVEEAGLLPPSPSGITSLTGTVKEIGDDYVEIEVAQAIRNPFDIAAPTLRRVMAGDETAVLMTEPRSPEEIRSKLEAYQAAQMAYIDALNSGQEATPPEPPQPFTEEPIDIGDIEVGSTVTVTAAEDILRAVSFTAARISVSPVPSAGAAPSAVPPVAQ